MFMVSLTLNDNRPFYLGDPKYPLLGNQSRVGRRIYSALESGYHQLLSWSTLVRSIFLSTNKITSDCRSTRFIQQGMKLLLL